MTAIAAGTRRAPASVRRRRLLIGVANHAVLITLAVVFATPAVFLLLTALMGDRQVLSARLWPSPFHWHNFVTAFTSVPLGRYLENTLLYAGLSTIGVVVSCVPVAYALSRLRWRGRDAVFILVLSTIMLPVQVTIIPLYVVFSHLHWIGTLKPLVVPSFFGDAWSIFLLRQFFLTIPQEMSDAARVDGAGELQVLLRVIVPMAKPAIAAIALFNFLYAWNDFFAPLVYLGPNPQSWTLSFALSQFSGQHEVQWNLTMAVSGIFILPVVVLFFFAQRAFIEGVNLTGLKG